MEIVLWKPLYYTSIGMFLLSLIMFPFSQTWSIVIILALVSIWSKVPGYVHFIFNKLALNDLFTFIVAAYLGGLAGGLFGVFIVLFGRIFGVNEYIPYTIRSAISLFVAAMATPLIVSLAGGVNIKALFMFEGVLYATYYAMVFLIFKDEIGLEMGLLPAVVLFDFILNAAWLGSFGNAINSMMVNGITSGWTFIVFAGVILGFMVLAKNGRKVAKYLTARINRIKGKRERNKTKEEILLEKIDKGEIRWGAGNVLR